MWLDVEGIEGPGLLAELARIIAKHGHNVQVGSLPADQREAAWRFLLWSACFVTWQQAP